MACAWRGFVAFAVLLLLPAWIHGSAWLGANGGGMQLGMNSMAYYGGSNPLLNWWTTSDAVVAISSLNGSVVGSAAWNAAGTASPGGGTAYFNPSTGELNNPVPSDLVSISRGFFTVPVSSAYPGVQGPGGTPWWYNQVWTMSWQGAATITFTGTLGSGGSTTCAGTSPCTITFGTTGVQNVAPVFTITDVNNPPHAIKIYQSGGTNGNADYTANVTAGQILNPDWVTLAGGFGIIRFMAGQNTNLNLATDFSQLADFNYTELMVSYAGNFGGANFLALPAIGSNLNYGPKWGLAPSVPCYITNITKSHPHYNIPMAMSNTGAAQIAAAWHQCSNPNLIPRFEYCNEIWNFGGGFDCFPYTNYQPWPPVGASAPYQPVITVSGIAQASSNPTVTTSSPHGFSNGNNVCVNLSPASGTGTMGGTLNGSVMIVGNATSNTFTLSTSAGAVNTTGLTFGSGTVYTCGSATTWGGYRSAQVMQQIYNTYGAGNRSKWRGVLGGQIANSAVATAAITGANFYIANEAPNGTTLATLFDEVDVAPYWGTSSLSGTTFSSVTKSGTPTVTVTNGVTNPFVNGEVIRIYAHTGMTQLNNQSATVSNVSGQTFTINIDTSTYSSWVAATGNFGIDNTLPCIVDQSVTLNGSTPATYPTKYSYFTQEISTSIITGTTANGCPSTGTQYLTDNAYNWSTNGLTHALQQNALIANVNGLVIRQYEGGNTFAYTDNNIPTASNGSTPLLYDFILNWRYDLGTATSGPQSIYTAAFGAYQGINGVYPSQFVEQGGGPGPFNGVRFFPGDSSNPDWTPVAAQNALGPYVDPTPAAGWVVTPAYSTSTNHNFSQSSGSTNTFSPATATVASTAIVGVTTTGGSITSVVDTTDSVTLTQVASTNSSGFVSAIFSGAIPAGGSTRSFTVTFSGAGFQNRNVYVTTVTGLATTTPTTVCGSSGTNPVSVTTGNPNSSSTLCNVEGSLIFTTGGRASGSLSYAGTSGISTGITSTIATDLEQADSSTMGMFSFPYTNPGFVISQGAPGGIAAATFR